jgi:hypothetical protein
VSVATVLPPDIVGAADENATQETNASSETWIDPEQAPADVCAESVAGFIAWLNVTAMVVEAGTVAPSVGTVETTCGGLTHDPAPSHTTPPLWLHGEFAGEAGWSGTPLTHASPVHWLPSSAGTSAPSTTLTTLPTPSHWRVWQSPGVCPPVTVPDGANDMPHVNEVQVRAWHSVSVPGHCEAVRHSTHVPVPLQTWPPFWLHAEPCGFAGWLGVPFTQTSFVHWLPSSAGRSPLSSTLTMLPEPSH